MLTDKYLPAYDFNECHSIKVNTHVKGIYAKMLSCDVSRSFLVRFLFRLRGMRRNLYTIEDITRIGFIKLEEQPGKEIIFGIITTSPTFSCCLSQLNPADFVDKGDPSIIKAVINFQLQEESNSTYIISTETRVWCLSKKMKARFRLYWLFIKPFSQLIRRSMLRQMKQQILKF